MRTLPLSATDDQIRDLVVEWHELLAAGRFGEALELVPSDTREAWTPESLSATIDGYGVINPDPDTIEYLRHEHGVERFEISSLAGRTDREAIVAGIDVDRENLYGLDPAGYLGMVHFDDVPLSGNVSDLTARFHIRRVGADELALEFLDLHVM